MVDYFETFGEYEELRVGFGKDYVGGGEGLGAESWIGTFGEQVESQPGGEPVFSAGGHSFIVAEHSGVVDDTFARPFRLDPINRLLA